MRNGPIPRTVQKTPLLIPHNLLLRYLFATSIDNGQALHGGRVQLEWLKLDIESILQSFLIDIHMKLYNLRGNKLNYHDLLVFF